HTIQFSLANKLLEQINKRLQLSSHLDSMRSKTIRYLNEVCVLKQFYQFHTTCLLAVIDMNSIFGSILIVSLLIHTPTNAFVLMSLIHNNIPQSQLPLAALIIIIQILLIFNIHWLAVVYADKVHSPGKKLIKCSVNLNTKTW